MTQNRKEKVNKYGNEGKKLDILISWSEKKLRKLSATLFDYQKLFFPKSSCKYVKKKMVHTSKQDKMIYKHFIK